MFSVEVLENVGRAWSIWWEGFARRDLDRNGKGLLVDVLIGGINDSAIPFDTRRRPAMLFRKAPKHDDRATRKRRKKRKVELAYQPVGTGRGGGSCLR